MRLGIAGREPLVDATAWIAPGAHVIGGVRIGPRSSVWYTTVIRADQESITLGSEVNIQDGSVLHTDPGLPLVIGDQVTVGHGARLHGCRIEDSTLIGMGAIILNGSVIGSGSIVGAGALVSEGTVVPPGSLVLGAPGRVRRPTTLAEQRSVVSNALHYVELADVHRQALDQIHRLAWSVARELPAAEQSQPFGPDHEVFKVCGKVFMMTTVVRGTPLVTLKCEPEQAFALRQEFDTVTAGYHMNKRHWISIAAGPGISRALVTELIESAYLLVVGALPRAKRVALFAGRGQVGDDLEALLKSRREFGDRPVSSQSVRGLASFFSAAELASEPLRPEDRT